MRGVFVSILIPLVFAIGCMPSENDPPIHRIVYGLTLVPSGIDPHIHASSELGIPLRQVYDTLVYRDPTNMEFVSGLASGWEVSEDGLTYTFSLKQNVVFHDGTVFNAQAVASNLDRITDSDTLSQRAAFMLGPYRGYNIIDDYTIQLLLSTPYAPLLDSLSQVYLGVASPAALAEYSNNRYQFHQVGTGPYKFVEYLPGDRIIIERNPAYTWGPDFYTKGPDDPGVIQEIEFRFFTDESTRLVALQNNDVQIMGEILPTDASALSASSDFQLITTPIPGQPAQFMFNTDIPPTNNRDVRQALLMALDRDAITDTVFRGFSPTAWSVISSNTLFYTNSLVEEFAYDFEAARQLLENAGYTDQDGNGFLDGSNGEMQLNLLVPGWGLLPQVAQIMQEQWRLLGVNVTLNPVPGFTVLLDRVESQPYHLVAFHTPGFDPAMLNEYFMTDANRNWMNYSNIQLDNTLIAAIRELEPTTRRGLYAQIQSFIISEALIVPIREYVNLNAATADLRGLQFDVYGWFPILNNVTIERQ